jgi:hypothetical protein
MSAGDIKKKLTIRSILYGRRDFYFDSKINKKDTCLVDKFKFTFDKRRFTTKSVSVLQGKANGGKKMKLKSTVSGN